LMRRDTRVAVRVDPVRRPCRARRAPLRCREIPLPPLRPAHPAPRVRSPGLRGTKIATHRAWSLFGVTFGVVPGRPRRRSTTDASTRARTGAELR
jgi:hypothetical protein